MPILMNISTLAIILPSVVTGVRLFGAIVDTSQCYQDGRLITLEIKFMVMLPQPAKD